MNNLSYLLSEITIIVFILKMFFICMCTYYTYIKILNNKKYLKKGLLIITVGTILIAIICGIIKYYYNYFSSIVCLILLLSSLYANINKNKLGNSLITTIISLSINYILYFISVIISFIPKKVLNINNDYISLCIIILIYLICLHLFFKKKRFKNGLEFLKINKENDYFDILILNISISILSTVIIVTNFDMVLLRKSTFGLIISSIIMFITIQKTLTMYYKHKMLVKDLNETKEELEKKNKEVEKLEQENLNFSKISHSISHKQKSLEHKLNNLMINSEFADELNIKERINKISLEYSKDKATVELTKTGIEEIDDMLQYMQSECTKNNIDFELQISGNIYYMTNNFISKEELEVLLADHIKDSIIAIQHSDNINRSILVRLGLIDEFYSLYIYDSGIEFGIDTLINLGTKPVTTHSDEGGTGMGFLNTFDTLRKYQASMIIDEIGKPSKDNYTKVIMIKFDEKNEFKVKSYRSEEIKNRNINNDMILI